MATTRPRPLSPHLTIWRWGPNMAASIFHRATGVAVSIAGLAVLTWWLMAIAEGQDAYDRFREVAKSPIGIVVLIGLTWSFFQHMFSGIRHLVMDTGANFDLRPNKTSAVLTFIGSIVATVAIWIYLLGVQR